MKVSIRKENSTDHAAVRRVIRKAFEPIGYSDHTEHFLVERLRRSDAFVPELSLVAETEGQIVGHILFSRVRIENDETSVESLALAPVSVLPEFQGRGIGGKLIEEGHRIAKKLGFTSVVLIGHEPYYPRFGYEQASKYGITFPFDAPEENCMVLFLSENPLEQVQGEVVYPKAFYK